MEKFVKACELCGKMFASDNEMSFRRAKYCSDPCRKEAKKRQNKESNKRLKAAVFKKYSTTKDEDDGDVLSADQVIERRKRRGDTRDYLLEDAIAARANEMTYGQYTSQRYAPRVIFPQNWRDKYK